MRPIKVVNAVASVAAPVDTISRTGRWGLVALGCILILPPVAHMLAHVWLTVTAPMLPHHGGDEWPKVAQVVTGATVIYPDPIIRLVSAAIRAWKGHS